MPRAIAPVDDVVKEHARVHLGEGVAKLAERPRLVPGRDGHEMRPEEPERLTQARRGSGGEVPQVIANGRDQLFAHALHRIGLEGIDGRQPLGQSRIAHLAADPQGKIVRIRLRQRRAVHEDGGHVAEHALRGHALELFAQLAHIVRLEVEELAQLEAAEEDEGIDAAHAALPGRGVSSPVEVSP
jgi:hypothetical protein